MYTTTTIPTLPSLPTSCGTLDKETVRKEFVAQHVPIPEDMLRAALSVAKTSESNNDAICYDDFVNSLNWRDFPVPPVQYQSGGGKDDWCGTKPANQINSVNYEPLLQCVFGNPLSQSVQQ